MIKLTECLRRAPHWSREEFLDYWYNHHGPLVKSVAKDLKMGRYVQTHIIDHPVNDFIRNRRGTAEPFDGVAEVWYESREAMEPSFSTPEMKAANAKLREDEERFLDLSQCVIFFSEEKVMIEA